MKLNVFSVWFYDAKLFKAGFNDAMMVEMRVYLSFL